MDGRLHCFSRAWQNPPRAVQSAWSSSGTRSSSVEPWPSFGPEQQPWAALRRSVSVYTNLSHKPEIALGGAVLLGSRAAPERRSNAHLGWPWYPRVPSLAEMARSEKVPASIVIASRTRIGVQRRAVAERASKPDPIAMTIVRQDGDHDILKYIRA